MNVTNLRTKAENQLREQFDDAASSLPGTGWVKTLRENAIAVFAADGLPHRRVEEWKYTDLRERLRDVPAPAAAPSKAVTIADLDRALGPLAALDAERIVLVDGVYRADLSNVTADAAVIELMSLAAMLAKAPGWLEAKFAQRQRRSRRPQPRLHDRRRDAQGAQGSDRCPAGAARARARRRRSQRHRGPQRHQRRSRRQARR